MIPITAPKLHKVKIQGISHNALKPSSAIEGIEYSTLTAKGMLRLYKITLRVVMVRASIKYTYCYSPYRLIKIWTNELEN